MAATAKTTALTVIAVLSVLIILLAVFPPHLDYIEIVNPLDPDDVEAGDSFMLWSIVAPVIAIGLALVTKRVYTSLFVGILAGVMIYGRFNVLVTFEALFTGFYDPYSGEYITQGLASTLGDLDNVGILLFLIILGAFVYLMRRAGGTAALGDWARKKLRKREHAQLMTVFLGFIVFIDDYFNCLTVGTVMEPVTDRFRVSRAKLAYLIDATAAPVCIIAPISSWAGAVSKYAGGQGAFDTFLSTIPYNFYAILTIVFIVTLILLRFDYGTMRKYETNAIEKGDLFSDGIGEPLVDYDISDHKGTILDLVVPILLLVVCCVSGMLFTGYLYGGDDIISLFSECDACIGLPLGSFFAFLLTLAFYYHRKVISFDDVWNSVPEGFKAMFPAIMILILAWTLKGTIDLMGADLFIADLTRSWVSGLEYTLPMVVFAVAMFLSFSTGTSWGTFGILIPICIALFPHDSTMTVICMSACMAGAVFGDHCSPISDTTIMAGTGSNCDLMTHVRTQFPYALTVAVVSATCFLIAGFVKNPWIPMGIGAVMVIGALLLLKTVVARRYGVPAYGDETERR